MTEVADIKCFEFAMESLCSLLCDKENEHNHAKYYSIYLGYTLYVLK